MLMACLAFAHACKPQHCATERGIHLKPNCPLDICLVLHVICVYQHRNQVEANASSMAHRFRSIVGLKVSSRRAWYICWKVGARTCHVVQANIMHLHVVY
jgi:hypothetical protein